MNDMKKLPKITRKQAEEMLLKAEDLKYRH